MCGKSTFHTQNDTNLRYIANKKYRLYDVRNLFLRASELRFSLAIKYTFPRLIRNILFFPSCSIYYLILIFKTQILIVYWNIYYENENLKTIFYIFRSRSPRVQKFYVSLQYSEAELRISMCY